MKYRRPTVGYHLLPALIHLPVIMEAHVTERRETSHVLVLLDLLVGAL